MNNDLENKIKLDLDDLWEECDNGFITSEQLFDKTWGKNKNFSIHEISFRKIFEIFYITNIKNKIL